MSGIIELGYTHLGDGLWKDYGWDPELKKLMFRTVDDEEAGSWQELSSAETEEIARKIAGDLHKREHEPTEYEILRSRRVI